MKTVNSRENSIIKEIEILKKLSHPNVIKLEDRIFSSNESPNIYCLVIEYCEVYLIFCTKSYFNNKTA